LNLFTTFVYIPFSFAYIIPMARCGSAITPDQRRVPKRVFAIMGALDGFSGIMQIFAATYLTGPLVILLTQAAIPISMAISKRLLRARSDRVVGMCMSNTTCCANVV
jgi:CRT-like, chloroquine-resistance transporter-like